MNTILAEQVHIPVGNLVLNGDLMIPEHAKGIVVFAHGSGSSRFSQRNRLVAAYLQDKSFGTLLFDLLTEQEDNNYINRFDIDLLARRLRAATTWLETYPAAKGYGIAYFGASTGAAAALKAAAAIPKIKAIVSRGGRPDLATDKLALVKAPTLMIVGGLDYDVLILNRTAYEQMNCEKHLEVIPGASHLFPEAGSMKKVCELATEWFDKYLPK